jgi:hypothetical protein
MVIFLNNNSETSSSSYLKYIAIRPITFSDMLRLHMHIKAIHQGQPKRAQNLECTKFEFSMKF